MGNGNLFYSENYQNPLPILGYIPLRGAVLEIDHDNNIRPLCMNIHTQTRTYYLCAETETSFDKWVTAISIHLTSLIPKNKLPVVSPQKDDESSSDSSSSIHDLPHELDDEM